MKPKLYYVLWHDAISADGWHTEEETQKFIKERKCLIEEVGWIISETKEEIVMASRRLKWSKPDTSEWGLLQKIPKTWIRKKRVVL